MAEEKKPLYKKWWFWLLVIIVVAAIAGGGSSNSSSSSSADSSQSASEAASSTSSSSQAATSSDSAKPAASLESISASYDGKTTEGTEINEKNRGLTVTGTYSDGSTATMKDFTVANPTKLEAGQTSQIAIECEGKSCVLDITCTTLSPDQFKASCEWVGYETLARNPDEWKGKNVAVYGKVMQVQEGWLSDVYLVQITQGDYGWWSDQVYVTFSGQLSTRILEDDLVNVYAVADGLYSYTTVLGAKQTVPSLEAKYIDIA